ncbi:hypothetical protein HYU15_02285 [Candidatus Woesearchaeota archaeon]|nr:hypothetical protein [Candidatus Woesearchaeota archaeon]
MGEPLEAMVATGAGTPSGSVGAERSSLPCIGGEGTILEVERAMLTGYSPPAPHVYLPGDPPDIKDMY